MSQTEHREPDPAVLATFEKEPGGEAGEWRLRVVGEVDVASSPTLRARISEMIDDGADRIVLDLSQMTFIDSSGLGVLVGALKRVRELDRKDLVLLGLQGPPRRVFEITGLTELFTIEA
ncbi:MAG TPA: STAS domain-containing protein [Acidimicrobiia bacterium]|nr:STAS domain-containing protein [Acidimicrobiia bacterium]